MDFKSEQKFVLVSPKKLRFVRSAISEMKDVSVLIDYLPHLERRAGKSILKVLKTAVANAKQAGTDMSDLAVKEMMINEGPRLKRGRAGSRGRLKPYKRLMSHIRIILTTKESKKKRDENSKKVDLKDTKPEAKASKKTEKVKKEKENK
jgi:large subunit ribosomal protein L22